LFNKEVEIIKEESKEEEKVIIEEEFDVEKEI